VSRAREMIASADVLIENFRPGVMQRLAGCGKTHIPVELTLPVE